MLELGELSAADAIKALSKFIDEDISLGNTYQKFFSYLIPREWDEEATFKTLANNYTSPGSLVKFLSPPPLPPMKPGRRVNTRMCSPA